MVQVQNSGRLSGMEHSKYVQHWIIKANICMPKILIAVETKIIYSKGEERKKNIVEQLWSRLSFNDFNDELH